MISTLKKKLNKKGFTLAELLIVIAIIAILVAIAVPTFTAQMNKAKEAVDDANLRSATSMAVADYLLNNYSGDKTYKAYGDTTGKTTNIAVGEGSNKPAGFTSEVNGQASGHTTMSITITDAGKVKVSQWNTGS